ncbi:MAG: hypothetical protein K8T91_26715 [Planctomycetes bacterium]|nr:hypothetical protein [Planctomycetota bacterium]
MKTAIAEVDRIYQKLSYREYAKIFNSVRSEEEFEPIQREQLLFGESLERAGLRHNNLSHGEWRLLGGQQASYIAVSGMRWDGGEWLAWLQRLWIPQKSRGKGLGTEYMKRICRASDECGISCYGTARSFTINGKGESTPDIVPKRALTTHQLQNWYISRFNFVIHPTRSDIIVRKANLE